MFMPFGDLLKSDSYSDENLSDNALKTAAVKVSFKADFSVWDHSDYNNNSCGGFPVFYITMKGYGTATHLGRLSTTITFCCYVVTGNYYNTSGSFVAANGDILFFEIPQGYLVPNEVDNSDYYQTRFNDPIIVTGGSGRFKGATGNLMTNAFVQDGSDESRTDFFITGTITLLKGK
jgi:hypothetical protein